MDFGIQKKVHDATESIKLKLNLIYCIGFFCLENLFLFI